MTVTAIEDPDLCMVCMTRPALADSGLCTTCAAHDAPWHNHGRLW
jgi:hypothetical protein